MDFKGANGPGGPELQALREYLSEDRFRPYLEASRGDAVKASSLYAWNTAASAALYGPLQVVEGDPAQRGPCPFDGAFWRGLV